LPNWIKRSSSILVLTARIWASISLSWPAERVRRISIGTDSHGLSQLEFIEFSLVAALKANITPDRILNFMSRDDLTRWAARLRDRGGNS
jgi:hypothetical protein